jgi:hypothetical protein
MLSLKIQKTNLSLKYQEKQNEMGEMILTILIKPLI